MSYMTVHKDLTAIKSKVVLGMTGKQLALVAGGLAVAVPVFLWAGNFLDGAGPGLAAVAAMAPFAFLAFYEKDGLPAERWVYYALLKALRPDGRPYVSQNIASFFAAPPPSSGARQPAGFRRAAELAEAAMPKRKPGAKGKAAPAGKPPKKPGILSLLTGGKKRQPKSAQETLPYAVLHRDGVMSLPGGRYSKTLVFGDVGYQLAQAEEQQKIFSRYCKFLNYIDETVHLQLSFVNRFASMADLKKKVEVASRGDRHDRYRSAYTDMIHAQMAKGNNGLVKSKFATLTVAAQDLASARSRLSNVEKDVLANFRALGVKAAPLDGRERVLLLYNQLHPDSNQKLKFDWKDLAATGMSTKDVIAPSGFEFKGGRRFMMGQSHACAMHLKITASEIPDDLLSQFLCLDSFMSVAMHLRAVDQQKALKTVSRKITDIDAMKLDYQKKASKSGYSPDIIPMNLQVYAEEARNLHEDMSKRNERMFLMTFALMFVADTAEKLDRTIESAKGIAQKENCELAHLDFQQEQGMVSCLALGLNELEVERVLTTSSTAIFVPFTTTELFEEKDGMYYGLNAVSNNLIMCNRKSLKNPNGLILGIPGAGKSFAAKREMLSVLLVTDDDVIVLDPEGEYLPFVKLLGGQVVELSQNSSNRVNPLDIHENYADGEDPVPLKSNFMLSFMELVMGSKTGLMSNEKTVIDRCVKALYKEYFLDPRPERMPVLGDLHALFLAEAGKGSECAAGLAEGLELYVSGSLNAFNSRSNVDMGNRLMCFDIKEMPEYLRPLGMLIVQDAVWARVSFNRQQARKTFFYIDEFHLLLKDEQTAQYSAQIWKRFRKWGGVPTGVTQNVEDLLMSREVSNIFKNTTFVQLLSQAAGDREVLARAFNLSEEQLVYVTDADPGCGLLIFGSAKLPFEDRFPKNELYYAMSTNPEDAGGGRAG